MSARVVGSLAFGLLVFLTACSGTTTGSGSSSGSTSSSGSSGGARQACLDMADVVAQALTRCGGTYQENYDAFLEGAAKGSCSNIVQVRDESSLRDTCFHFFQNATCAQLKTLDASCKEQLIRSSRFEPELAPASNGKAEGWVGVGAE